MRVQKGGAIRREIRNNVSIIIEFDLRSPKRPELRCKREAGRAKGARPPL